MTELREFLKTTLPDYMIPAAFVFLPALPLTPNGKIDRKALPEQDIASMTLDRIAPRDALEEIVVGLWCAVLNQHAIGIHDNFFELGGHSLLATQLTSRLRDTFDIAISVRWIFEAPTVAELSQRIRVVQIEEAEASGTRELE
jgi:acyl carrier protein